MLKPGDLPLDEFRRAGHDVIDAIAAYYEQLDTRPVLPHTTPAAVTARFTDEFAEYGEPADALLADWKERVAPLLTTIGSPRHFAYVNGSGSMVGVFADALAAGVNTNAGAWKLGPAATEIERQVLRWIAGFIGYPEDTGGILVSGGTMANFTAILTALRHVAPYDSTPHGLQDRARRGRFLLYMSDHEGHISVVRAVDMLNLGRESIRRVPSRPDFTLDPEALDRMLTEDRERGDIPFCVVAQLGSVNVGAVDPLDAIANVCAKHGVWLHGDGAIGLLAAGLAETKHLFRGIERADSLSFDAHKWLGVPNDCGVVLVRHAERLRRAFSISAPYLRDTHDDGEELDFLEYGPQMSRGFRALKVWMVLRFFGASGLRALIAKNIALARRLHTLVHEHPDFVVLHEPVLTIESFRFVPRKVEDRQSCLSIAGADGEGTGRIACPPHDDEDEVWIDQLNAGIAEEIQRCGLALVMTTRIRGRVALRMSICSQRTTEEDIDLTFTAIAAAGRRLAAIRRAAAHR